MKNLTPILILLMLVMVAFPAAAQQQYFPGGVAKVSPIAPPAGTPAAPVAVAPYTFTPLGCQQITSLSAAAGFASVPTGATLATISVETQPVRYRDDGTNPTASVGVYLPVGGPWPYSGSLSAIKFIQIAASTTIDVCFSK